VIDLTAPETAIVVPDDGSDGPTERRVRLGGVDPAEARLGLGCALASLCGTWLVYERLTPLSGALGFAVVWWTVFVAITWFVARERHGAIGARDHIARVVIWSCAALVLIPLVSLIGAVVAKGFHALSVHFFTQDQSFVGPLTPANVGGASQAIVGTLEQVGLAVLVSVPLGFGTAIFLNEVGGPLARPVRTLVDAMSALPSIVAGLFIYTSLIQSGYIRQSGIAAALALSVLMLPTVARTAEVVLRLVPSGLREASYALGATEWKTTRKVVLPTARSGLTTAIILGVGRIVGETAAVLLTAFGNATFNANPASGPQSSLSLYVYQLFKQQVTPAVTQRMWTGTLVLVLIVLVLFVLARVLGGRGPGHIGRIKRLRLARRGLT
jgi:phosphate transport system permease protein